MTHPELQRLVAEAIYYPTLGPGQRLEFYHRQKADAVIEAVVRWLETRVPELAWHSEWGDPVDVRDSILSDMEGRSGD